MGGGRGPKGLYIPMRLERLPLTQGMRQWVLHLMALGLGEETGCSVKFVREKPGVPWGCY